MFYDDRSWCAARKNVDRNDVNGAFGGSRGMSIAAGRRLAASRIGLLNETHQLPRQQAPFSE